MANLFIFANNASTSLATPITNTATQLTVSSGTGIEFPNPSSGQQFSATLNDAATGLLTEIVYCTGISGDTLNPIVRAQEGTSALSWLAGDLVANLLTAGQMAAMVQSVQVAPNRIVTASGAFTTTTADANGNIGLNRTSGLGTSTTTLPSGASAGQTYTYEDLAGNFGSSSPVATLTVNAPGGMTIAGLPAVVLNTNRTSATFTYYGSNIWGVKVSSL
jgi:hypothetical protein